MLAVMSQEDGEKDVSVLLMVRRVLLNQVLQQNIGQAVIGWRRVWSVVTGSDQGVEVNSWGENIPSIHRL